MWQAQVITLFPEMFPGPLSASLVGQALSDGLWSLSTVNIRDHGIDRHRTVDDVPFGGGPGMVMRPDALDGALDAAKAAHPGLPLVLMSPRGRPIDQARVAELAAGPGVAILCGRFEGIDERLIEAYAMEELSIGDFVLSGGELAAMAMLDACVRLLPGAIGKSESLAEESFENHLLEYPHYTRPQVWRERTVPEVLLSGHHENIRKWRLEQAKAVTERRRPDLWARYVGKNS
jgi:tRNA (guanine37-N1)-methyltransferase